MEHALHDKRQHDISESIPFARLRPTRPVASHNHRSSDLLECRFSSSVGKNKLRPAAGALSTCVCLGGAPGSAPEAARPTTMPLMAAATSWRGTAQCMICRPTAAAIRQPPLLPRVKDEAIPIWGFM